MHHLGVRARWGIVSFIAPIVAGTFTGAVIWVNGENARIATLTESRAVPVVIPDTLVVAEPTIVVPVTVNSTTKPVTKKVTSVKVKVNTTSKIKKAIPTPSATPKPTTAPKPKPTVKPTPKPTPPPPTTGTTGASGAPA